MVIGQSVLLVDGLSETEQVLKAVLEPRGLRVDRVRRHVATPESERPSVVVLHESEADSSPGHGWDGIPRVIIGSTPDVNSDADDQQHLPHPFQYRELIQAIESLLQKPSQNSSRSAAKSRC